ncbi:MAG: hypothetical protein S4CHLAM20_10570 [Chlamydiia bacterium]|nr:hypothetical protein [Chlamydiia bacterium]
MHCPISPRSSCSFKTQTDVDTQKPSLIDKSKTEKECLSIASKVMLSLTIASTIAAITLAFISPPAMFTFIAIALTSGLITTVLFIFEERAKNLIYQAMLVEVNNKGNFKDII